MPSIAPNGSNQNLSLPLLHLLRSKTEKNWDNTVIINAHFLLNDDAKLPLCYQAEP